MARYPIRLPILRPRGLPGEVFGPGDTLGPTRRPGLAPGPLPVSVQLPMVEVPSALSSARLPHRSLAAIRCFGVTANFRLISIPLIGQRIAGDVLLPEGNLWLNQGDDSVLMEVDV